MTDEYPLTISVITPSFNQGGFLERTIQSVLGQNYPGLEYIIIDGGSQDQSCEIISKFKTQIAFWHSAKDRGQTDAINQGLSKANGDVLAWLNSDDTYLPDTLNKISRYFCENPSAQLVYGNAYFIDQNDQILMEYRGAPIRKGSRAMEYWRGWNIPQPTVFFRRELIENYGLLDESYSFAFDYEWLIRVHQHIEFHYMNDFLANYRLHDASKTGDWEANKHKFHRECKRVNLKYAPLTDLRNLPLWLKWAVFPLYQITRLVYRKLKSIKP